MIKFKDFLYESLDKPYSITYDDNSMWARNGKTGSGIEAWAISDSGIRYKMMAINIGRSKKQREQLKKSQDIILEVHGGFWEIHFWSMVRTKGNFLVGDEDKYSNDITGVGDSQRVFATLLEFTKHLIEHKDPDAISIISKSDEGGGSRTKLYNAIIKRYATKYGYRVKNTKKSKTTTRVDLVKIKETKYD